MASRVGLCGFLTVHNYNVGNKVAQESAIVTFKMRDENFYPMCERKRNTTQKCEKLPAITNKCQSS